MRILIAPQEFKGSLSAREAAQALASGLRRSRQDAELDLLPLADGGPGTVTTLVEATSGRYHESAARDPLGRPLGARWGALPDGTAVIEMAAASGLALLAPEERDPKRASTFGTGELLRAALAAGHKSCIVGVGGSATNDGGAGLAQALGARLLDADGSELRPGGARLAQLARIDMSDVDPRIPKAEIIVAADVTNPLCGVEGASLVYGPQKGASEQVARELDAALAHYAAVVERDLGVAIADLPGAGAAGGLAAGLIAFCGARLRPGFKVVAELVGLAGHVQRADVVITGEGRLDRQTAYGKTTAGVARMARAAGKRVVAIVGSVADDYDDVATRQFDEVHVLATGTLTLDEAMARAAELLAAAAERAGRQLE